MATVSCQQFLEQLNGQQSALLARKTENREGARAKEGREWESDRV